ncbi:MAG TPA: hypothetical protein VFN30_00505, partial [Chitinophagaceae bacterium]|nr:hypothetical protein [Chitinophagaceae bacterium]
MIHNYHKLNNPAWHALTEKHQLFSIGTSEIKKYQRYVAPWVGYLSDKHNIFYELDAFIENEESVYVFDTMPSLPPNYIHETTVHCLQMICEKVILNKTGNELIEKLEDRD